MARHRHPPAPGASPATRDPACRGRRHRGARDRRRAQARAGPGQLPVPGGGVRAGSCPGRRGGAGQHDRDGQPGLPGLRAAVPVMTRGHGTAARSPAAGCAHVAAGASAPPWPGGRLTRQHLPRRPGLPGEPGPFRVPASARQPADVSRGARQVIRATGTREPAVTAGTVPTGRPSSCRAWEPGRGRRICGRTPVTREGSRR